VRVWQQVESQEARSGERPTHSLAQIMQEDSETCELQKNVIKDMNEELRILPQQNGILIALNGGPLLSEFFSDSLEITNTVRKTVLASSFDTTDMSRS
jgi:hypothetical protein